MTRVTRVTRVTTPVEPPETLKSGPFLPMPSQDTRTVPFYSPRTVEAQKSPEGPSTCP